MKKIQDVFFEDMKKQLNEKGTVTCSFPLCSCPHRQELLPNKMHVFVRPNGEAVDACCDMALTTIVKVYNVNLEAM